MLSRKVQNEKHEKNAGGLESDTGNEKSVKETDEVTAFYSTHSLSAFQKWCGQENKDSLIAFALLCKCTKYEEIVYILYSCYKSAITSVKS